MTIKFIGITGGSGAGKTTLGNNLKNKYSDKIELVQLDDYFKPKSERPKLGDIINSGHPDALYLDKLAEDLIKLSRGESVVIHTRNEYLNPEYEKTKKQLPFLFHPKPIVLVEGFLLLHHKKIRKLFNTSIFLDANHEVRWNRCAHIQDKGEEYKEKIMIPMHEQYIEPTKKYTEHIIDSSELNVEQVFKKAEKIVFDNLS